MNDEQTDLHFSVQICLFLNWCLGDFRSTRGKKERKKEKEGRKEFMKEGKNEGRNEGEKERKQAGK